jgi:hypothetical protein
VSAPPRRRAASFYDAIVSDERGDGKANVHDSPRLLAQRSELGYVDRVDKALPDEPEAISRHEQEALSLRARRDWVERRRRAWAETQAVVAPALDAFAAVVANDRALVREVRVLRRGLDRVGQRVAG